jgi:hypothetical protein
VQKKEAAKQKALEREKEDRLEARREVCTTWLAVVGTLGLRRSCRTDECWLSVRHRTLPRLRKRMVPKLMMTVRIWSSYFYILMERF